MNKLLPEKEFQKYIVERLKNDNGYVTRGASHFDRRYAIDKELLFSFLQSTQPEELEALQKVYGTQYKDRIVKFFNNEATKDEGSLLYTLKHGLDISHIHLDLLYTKPANSFNAELVEKYEKNIFSVSEEVWASDAERVDLVIFINGIAVVSMELKSGIGQSYEDAIYQYRTERNPITRLFRFKAGCLVNFAMDTDEVYMTTHLEGEATYFLPFNMGNGRGINAGAGNPKFEDKFSVSYMWEDILKKDTLLEIINEFMFLEVKPEKDITGKPKRAPKETLIFPRYHQLDVVRKLLADVYKNGTSQNYLIQHSAGSGKTNSIAWLAYRFATLHDAQDKAIFDNIIVVTDRVIVDRQLQTAINSIEHDSGLIRLMDDSCKSKDLKRAIEGNTKIIGTTIQKFPYIVEQVTGLKGKKFAVLIDEAHSSTTGKEMAAVKRVLGSGGEISGDAEDYIAAEMQGSHKQKNVAMFAFTATPKATTLQLFGRLNRNGNYEAFHLYSMKQAIEEHFILDVLENYITYETYYQLNKEVEDDPLYKTAEAKRQIARFVSLHDTNIAQRISIIVEHFRTTVMKELGGTAKAMVVTDSRAAAVKYRKAFEEYIKEKGYKDIHALVAFTGKVKLHGDDTVYTETGMNGFSENKTADAFDKGDYQVLLVASKYQTGFDQKKLCAMYVIKDLKGISAVQTLSRLNRVVPGFDKKTVVLDFKNSYEDIDKAFSRYYKGTFLVNSVTPKSVYNLVEKIDMYNVLDFDDIKEFNDIVFNPDITSKDKQRALFLLERAKEKTDSLQEVQQREFILTLKHFVRCYEFIIQATCLEDVEMHKKYIFIGYLLSKISVRHAGDGFNLNGKIEASQFMQKKQMEHKSKRRASQPAVALATASIPGLAKIKIQRLSEILDDINSKTGKNFNKDVIVHTALQIYALLKASEKLKTSAKSNTAKNFELTYFGVIDDILIEGLEENKEFYSLLLSNEDLKKEMLGVFKDDIYNTLRKG